MTSTSTPDTGAPPSPLSFRVDLPLADRATVLARRTVAGVLHSWQVVDEDWTYDVLLVTSELVANAVRHGGQRVELVVTLADDELTVAVTDGSPVVPAQRPEADESGRGLAIVAALATQWGVTEQADGKAVWARLSLPPAPPVSAEQPGGVAAAG